MNVGDTVFLKAVGNLARNRKELIIREFKILKIGRKYFEVGIDGDVRPLKFRLDDKTQENGGYIADWELYFSKQDILDEEEFNELAWNIKLKFSDYGKVNLTLDQLRRISLIIKEETK